MLRSGGIFLEVDVTKKAIRFLQFGLLGFLTLTALTIGGVWLYQRAHNTVTLEDVQVKSALVPAKAKADGTISEILVTDGAHVNAGDVIAHIKLNVTDEDLVQLQQNVDLAKKSLADLQKGIAVTQPMMNDAPIAAADTEAARQRLERMNELYAMGAISAVKRDEAEAAYNAALAADQARAPAASYRTVMQPASAEQIKQAELFLKQAEIALTKAQQDKAGTDITATVSGTLYLAEGVSVGSRISSGQTFANIGNAEDLWLDARIDVKQKENVRLGQFASYRLNGREMQGTVQDIEDDAEAGDGEESLPEKIHVRISIPEETGAEILPGTRVTVRLSP